MCCFYGWRLYTQHVSHGNTMDFKILYYVFLSDLYVHPRKRALIIQKNSRDIKRISIRLYRKCTGENSRKTLVL
jgi:hypothetical protein